MNPNGLKSALPASLSGAWTVPVRSGPKWREPQARFGSRSDRVKVAVDFSPRIDGRSRNASLRDAGFLRNLSVG